ncbi:MULTISPECIES: hypothetical protein [unclassified Breznakia]|uniref:hypothetical protein n=1 Tax=unclassified Breznakia TaxID=2623764 RepID=UPI0024764D6E|nr:MULTISPECIES: hypothetical protein [unclassified Breznakia]MDH6416647.1 hypothetical protein [Breznakia sp. PFB1-4]MDH6474846.1 hypothetical protein [Breznakia sp. PFB2-30]MDH6476436.1 hypothetical protein [Breznakia sp. PFB1-19]MDH6367145.1 hypothetical protein [Breznakia sp. PH1-1]MDH6404268.1 hypothetical protein [Breznakia sp. PF1-11]
MFVEQLAKELGISIDSIKGWLKRHEYPRNAYIPIEVVTLIRKYYHEKLLPNTNVPMMNKLCKGCPKGHISDQACAMNGTQRGCLHYKVRREKRKKVMPRIEHGKV